MSIIAPFGKSIFGFDIIFGLWQRRAEYTADRSGLLVSRNIHAAIRSIIKLASGPDAVEHTEVEAFIEQARSIDSSQVDRVGELLGTHPYVTNRIRQLLAFSESALYQHLTSRARAAGPVPPPPLPSKRRRLQALTCTACNAAIEASDMFCSSCGAQLSHRARPHSARATASVAPAGPHVPLTSHRTSPDESVFPSSATSDFHSGSPKKP